MGTSVTKSVPGSMPPYQGASCQVEANLPAMPRTAQRCSVWNMWFILLDHPSGRSPVATPVRDSSSLICFSRVMAHLSSSCTMGMPQRVMVSFLLAGVASHMKHVSSCALDIAKCLHVIMSERSMMMLPGTVGTSKASASSSKGFSSRVPLMGPRQKMTMILARMKMLSQLAASASVSSTVSSAGMPVSWATAWVRSRYSKPRSGSMSWMRAAVSVIASSTTFRPAHLMPLSASFST
mmetsp:Transcript_41083/g.106249  ORF Transcript_41083/g.106249 Transcript_41083/m.106249 type:complete len:237 (+) Transcript_41083:2701-3411(+)